MELGMAHCHRLICNLVSQSLLDWTTKGTAMPLWTLSVNVSRATAKAALAGQHLVGAIL